MRSKFRRKLCRLVKVYYHLGEKITLYLGKIVFLLKENSNVCVESNFPGKGKFLFNHCVCLILCTRNNRNKHTLKNLLTWMLHKLTVEWK